MHKHFYTAAGVFLAGHILIGNSTEKGAGIAAGLLLAMMLPDLCERRMHLFYMDTLELIYDKDGKAMTQATWCPRNSDTHWFVPWLSVAIFASFFNSGIMGVLEGTCIASLTHIAIDACGKEGVPIWKPRGKKIKLGIRFNEASPAIGNFVMIMAILSLAWNAKQHSGQAWTGLMTLITLPFSIAVNIADFATKILG